MQVCNTGNATRCATQLWHGHADMKCSTKNTWRKHKTYHAKKQLRDKHTNMSQKFEKKTQKNQITKKIKTNKKTNIKNTNCVPPHLKSTLSSI